MPCRSRNPRIVRGGRACDSIARTCSGRAIVEEQAQSYENPQEVVRWYYQAPDRLREIESMVLEDNVVEWALKTAKVEDTAIPFDELMGNRQ